MHVEQVEARAPRYAPWPQWADPLLVERLRASGMEQPWAHQAAAAELLHSGRHTVLATGTASGKSAGYLLPALSRLLTDAERGATGRGGTVLYLAPTKALAHDQARRLRELELPLPPAVCLDGDTSPEERRWIREYGAFVLSNPDMLHYSMLPDHRRWSSFLRRLAPSGTEQEDHLLLSGFVRSEATLAVDTAAGAAARNASLTYGAVLRRLTDADRFPAVHRVIESGVFDDGEEEDPSFDGEFQFGLERLLDGIEVLITRAGA